MFLFPSKTVPVEEIPQNTGVMPSSAPTEERIEATPHNQYTQPTTKWLFIDIYVQPFGPKAKSVHVEQTDIRKLASYTVNNIHIYIYINNWNDLHCK